MIKNLNVARSRGFGRVFEPREGAALDLLLLGRSKFLQSPQNIVEQL
ncbi:MAG: hypothetical protein L0211_07745 [Planctomycetaceae bacterium]|nr:hypothetical protein [Planctomycetaceae bacterium]